MKNKLNIYVENDFVEDLMDNSYKYSMDQALFIAKNVDYYRNKILGHYLLQECISNKQSEFREYLTDLDMYDKFIIDVVDGNDEFLKAIVTLYLEPSLMVNDPEQDASLANAISQGKYSIYYKLPALVKLSEYNIGEGLTKALKIVIKNLINKSKEFKKQYDEPTIEELVMYYEELVDDNQKQYNKKYSFNKEK